MKPTKHEKVLLSIKGNSSLLNRIANIRLSSFPNKKTKVVERFRFSQGKRKLHKNIIYIEPFSFENYFVDDVSFKMIYCPPNIEPKQAKQGDQSSHTIVSRGFYIGETQVTQALWKKIYPRWNPSQYRGTNQPVEQITWFDCLDFCNKLSKLNNYKPCYVLSGISRNPYENNNITKMNFEIIDHANGFRLPLLEEWIYAAKAGTYNNYVGTNDIEIANQTMESQSGKDVKLGNPNEWGIYDFKNLIYEWCEDEYSPPFPNRNDSKTKIDKERIKHNIVGLGLRDRDRDNLLIQRVTQNYITFYSDQLGMRLARTP